ncbi:MAG: nucleotidyltransferase domain-containing protein, partial [bacterium]
MKTDSSMPASESILCLRAELQLLLGCAQISADEPAIAKMRALAKREIKWRALLRIANDHKVSPLLYRRLHAHGAEQVPPAILSRLRQQCLENSRRNFFMAGELLRILALLKAHGIEGIPYKGPALAMLAYGDLSAREFGDLDIMVHEKDHLQARDLLAVHGYQLHLTKAQQMLKYLHHYHYEFTCAGNGARVEIHWQFTERFWQFRFEPLRLWQRLQ